MLRCPWWCGTWAEAGTLADELVHEVLVETVLWQPERDVLVALWVLTVLLEGREGLVPASHRPLELLVEARVLGPEEPDVGNPEEHLPGSVLVRQLTGEGG